MDTLEHFADRSFDATEKGFGVRAGDTPKDIVADRPYLLDAGLSLPLLTLRESALEANAQAMASYCAARGVDLAPHGKTGMSPEMAALQLRHGAWAITVATFSQLRAYQACGFRRLLLANELTDPAELHWLAAAPSLEAYFYVDDPSFPTKCAISPARPLPVLVEIGYQHGRTGCRTDEQAIDVAKAVASSRAFRLAGVAGYEGTMHGDDALDRVTEFCSRLRRLADRLRDLAEGPDDFIVTAGGSTYFDIVTDQLTAGDASGLRVVLRSGAYLYHDHGIYAKRTPAARGNVHAPRFTPAIELWARVQSRPEPGLALLGFGRRDAGTDSGLPVPLGIAGGPGSPVSPGWTVTQLDDQHAYLQLPAQDSLAPGDIVRLGISHPCTTLDKWRLIPVLDDNDRIVNVVHSFW